MLQTFHKDPKVSYQLVENGYPMTPLIYIHIFIMSLQCEKEIVKDQIFTCVIYQAA